MKKILVIGSTNTDFVLEVEEMPRVGETIMSKFFHSLPGGKGANQAYACGMLGGHVSFLSAIGGDGLGSAVMENMRRADVAVSHIRTMEADSTGIAVICVDGAGNNSIVVSPGANLRCDCDYLKEHRETIDACDILLVQLEVPVDGIFYAITYAHKRGKLVILNPAPCPDGIPDEVLRCVDYITPNESELMKLCGKEGDSLEDYAKGARLLLRKGVKNVLVTLGKKGALFVSKETEELFPARKVSAVDTTAAGDCFNGAFAVALAEGRRLDEAVAFANAASSIAVTRCGAQTSIPAREETDKVLAELSGQS